MAHEYTIYCDESEQAGAFFGGFYGGVLVPSDRLSPAIATLDRIKREQNLFGEVKWQKVSPNYLAKYATFIDGFFDLLANGGDHGRSLRPPGLVKIDVEGSELRVLAGARRLLAPRAQPRRFPSCCAGSGGE